MDFVFKHIVFTCILLWPICSAWGQSSQKRSTNHHCAVRQARCLKTHQNMQSYSRAETAQVQWWEATLSWLRGSERLDLAWKVATLDIIQAESYDGGLFFQGFLPAPAHLPLTIRAEAVKRLWRKTFYWQFINMYTSVGSASPRLWNRESQSSSFTCVWDLMVWRSPWCGGGPACCKVRREGGSPLGSQRERNKGLRQVASESFALLPSVLQAALCLLSNNNHDSYSICQSII